jgi:hypothetical protein
MPSSIRATLRAFAIWAAFASTFATTFASTACAQQLSFGVAGGTNITANFPTTDTSAPADMFGNPANRFQYMTGPRSPILGGLVGIGLPDGFSLEANVLERPMLSTLIFTQYPASGGATVYRNTFTSVRAWEFPVLVKYSLPAVSSADRLRPFLEAGPSFRTQENASGTQPSQFGLSAGAGIAFHVGKIQIAPTLRYTRWDHESIYPKFATKPDQVELLTSVAYETDSNSRRLAGRKIEIGAIAGLPLTHGFLQPQFGDSIVERTPYLAGLTTQINLVANLSVEVDGIYKPLRAENIAGGQQQFSVITWQFPVLAKYRWSSRAWKPFAEAGPSFRLAGNLNGYNPSHYGITAGGGVETSTHGVRLSPGLRFTRWEMDAPPYPSSGNQYYDRTKANAIELIFGVSF